LLSGCQDVYYNCQCIWHLLVAIPWLLFIRLSQQRRGPPFVHKACLSKLLLPGNVERHRQPHHLFLDECQVMTSLAKGTKVWITKILLPQK